MGLHRMFSKNIINSARFLKMPPSTQMLYFHLILNADDDGVVEAFTIMRMTGAAEDDLKVLISKNFVTILSSEDLIAWINDWFEHNTIRADRKVDSKYKDLLLQIVKNIKLVEPKKRADRKGMGQSQCGQSAANGRLKLSKDNISKDNKEKEINKEKEKSADSQFSYFENEEFKKTFLDFLEMRKKNKKPTTDRAQELILKKLHEQQLYTAITMLEQSILNNWQDVYLPKLENQNANNKFSGQGREQQPKPGSVAAAELLTKQIENWAIANDGNLSDK